MTLILGIAAVAAIGVPMNALFFQDGRHPAPLFSAQRSNAITVPPTPPTRPAAIEAARTERETFIQARPTPKDAIASKLEKLDAKPLEAGKTEPAKADLTRTDKTRDAIGLLILSKAPPTASADKADKTEKAASPEKTAQVDKNVLYAQRALLRLGYVVRADGVLNNATRHALEKFERDAGQPGKGKITPKVLKLLATLSGLARP
ncbi:peptidoglycan-binding protein [Methylocystis sp.]|uniref:peptidoglycan-binding protein n=1 Tax=Methylocystis sp. TaxID=1911079 RepID=UPI0025FCCC04|nr:peptidoglycan-binding protein [Methylocystis sp.]